MPSTTAKTTENDNSFTDFILNVPDKQKQDDSFALVEMMQAISGYEPRMWGPAIIGFGTCHYKYESGREGDMPRLAFSPRKQSLTLYLSGKFEGREELLKQLGKHSTSIACIYIKRLSDVDVNVLKKMIANSLKHTDATYPL